jgi:hypothetical protein
MLAEGRMTLDAKSIVEILSGFPLHHENTLYGFVIGTQPNVFDGDTEIETAIGISGIIERKQNNEARKS